MVLLLYPRWGGVSLRSFCPRSFVDHANTPPFPTEMMEDFRLKRPENAAGTPLGRAANTEDFARQFPTLAEHLTALQYDGEPPTPRQTSTLLIFAQDGSWRALLRDRQEQRCLWVTSPLWDDLLTVLELALQDPTAVWREDRLSGAETAKRMNPKKGSG